MQESQKTADDAMERLTKAEADADAFRQDNISLRQALRQQVGDCWHA